jgi:hypothetical protein
MRGLSPNGHVNGAVRAGLRPARLD